MIKAAITPGTQPRSVRIKTIKIEPQPLSITASGGKRTDNITLQILIYNYKDINFYSNRPLPFPAKKQLIGYPLVCIFASPILK
jgi:hypothetical protein